MNLVLVKKKVLIVTRNFPPLIGGMEKLNYNIFQALASKFDTAISGPVGSSLYHNASRFVEFSSGPLWKYIVSSFFKTLYLSCKVKPEIVFCGSGAAILAGYFSAKITNAKLVCYLHGLDIVADSFIYQNLFLPLIKKSDLVFVNSNHSKALAVESGIDLNRIEILFPGVSMPDMIDSESLVMNFRQQYNLTAPFILVAGRITRRKGVLEFIENVMPALIAVFPELKLVVIGDEAKQAMNQQLGVKDEIIQCVNDLHLQNNVCLLGGVTDHVLSSAFMSAEMLVFPLLDLPNDVEGFGMVAIEAAAHGLPTVAFSVGGATDSVSNDKSGWLIEANDYLKMTDIILERLGDKQIKGVTRETCIQFAAQFEWEVFGEKLRKHLLALEQK